METLVNMLGNGIIVGLGVAIGINIGAEIVLKKLMNIKEVNITYNNPTVNNINKEETYNEHI